MSSEAETSLSDIIGCYMKQRVLKMIDEVSRVVENIPELTHLGNPILRQETKTVSKEEGIKIAHQLIAILDKYKNKWSRCRVSSFSNRIS